MKKFLIALIASGALCTGAANADYSSPVSIGKINSWRVNGGNWSNAGHAGGFSFTGTIMPTTHNVTSFEVLDSDIGLKNLMSFMMMAINNNWTVGLMWEKINPNCTSNCSAKINSLNIVN